MTGSSKRYDAWYFGRRPDNERRTFWLMVAVAVVKPTMMVMFRRHWSGMRHVPRSGGVIFAVNHISQTDPLPVAHYVYNSGRNPHFLAKDGVFRIPVLGKLIGWTGQIPVYRGGSDAIKSLHAAIEAVDAGQSIIFYPEGTTSKQPEHWPMRGRTGVARLALETGAQVIPVSVWGPHRLFNPITKKWRPRLRTKVRIAAGVPVDLSKWEGEGEPTLETLEEVTETIMLRVRDQLAEIREETPPPLYDYKAHKSSRKEA